MMELKLPQQEKNGFKVMGRQVLLQGYCAHCRKARILPALYRVLVSKDHPTDLHAAASSLPQRTERYSFLISSVFLLESVKRDVLRKVRSVQSLFSSQGSAILGASALTFGNFRKREERP